MFFRKHKTEEPKIEEPKTYYHWVLRDRNQDNDAVYDKLCKLFASVEPSVGTKYNFYIYSSCTENIFTFPSTSGCLVVSVTDYSHTYRLCSRSLDVTSADGKHLCGFSFWREAAPEEDVDDSLCSAITACLRRIQAKKTVADRNEAERLINHVLAGGDASTLEPMP